MIDLKYAALLDALLHDGESVTTRNDKVKRLFAYQMQLKTTPLISLRKTAWRSALREWQWFMSGSNRIEDLHPSVRKWWEPWVDADGKVPLNYSRQFRAFNGTYSQVDQVLLMLEGIKNHPFSRRNVLTTWNTADMVEKSCLITNCHHTITQAFVSANNTLHLVTYQRSVDVICGLPHNLIQSWAFLLWLSHHGSRIPGSLTWIGGDVHLYEIHCDLAQRMINTNPRSDIAFPPELIYKPTNEEFLADDFSLDGEYKPLIEESAEMVV